MPVVIAGMYHSGTSIITELLNLCGLYLGEKQDLAAMTEDNPESFGENIKFQTVNHEILTSFGGSWDTPPILEHGWEKSDILINARTHANHALKAFTHHEPWGWKDARNSLTLPFWKKLIPDLKILICVRNPDEVYRSLERHGLTSSANAYHLWLTYNEQVLSATKPDERIITHYDAFFCDPQAELRRLVDFLGLDVSDTNIQEACKAASFNLGQPDGNFENIQNTSAPHDLLATYRYLCLQAGSVYDLSLSPKNLAEKTGAAAEPLEKYKNRVSFLQEQIAQKDKLIFKLSEETKQKEQDLQKLNLNLEAANAKANQILQSRSWRLIGRAQRMFVAVIPRASFREQVIRKILGEITGALTKLKRNRKIASFYKGPVSKSPRISIIIPVHNQIEQTLNCLFSIATSQDQANYEIIIIDDAATDKTQKNFENIRGIRYIRNTSHPGFLASCNEAAKSATGAYLVFLNNDSQVHKLWLDNLLATFSLIPNTGLVGSKLISPNRKLLAAGGIIGADGSANTYGRDDDPESYRYNYVREVDYVSAASMMLPKTLWENLGGFDPQYKPAYYEDVDLAFKIREAGYQVIYQPFSQVTQYDSASNEVAINSDLKRHQAINQEKFFNTWQKTIKDHGSPAKTLDYVQQNRFVKGQVLFIDESTPQPDYYAGGVLSEFYITTLREAGFAVTFLPYLNLDHAYKHTRSLQKKGIECVYQPYVLSSEQYIIQNGYRFDYVVISRAEVGSKIIDLVKAFAPEAKIIFNTIDLRFLRLDRAAQLSGKDEDTQAANQAKEEELSVMRKAHDTLVVSNVEQQLLTQLAPGVRVKVVPFPADVHESEKSFAEREDIVFVGGFLHKPNADAVLFFTKEIWPLVAKKLPQARFVIAGANITKEILELESENIFARGFVDDLGQLFATARLSVAPLRFGAGIKGKVLTSLGYGVPCIATSIAAEGIGLTDGVNILVANTPEEFADAVVKAYTSAELWESLSKQGQAWIRQNYSRPVVAAKLLSVFEPGNQENTRWFSHKLL